MTRSAKSSFAQKDSLGPLAFSRDIWILAALGVVFKWLQSGPGTRLLVCLHCCDCCGDACTSLFSLFFLSVEEASRMMNVVFVIELCVCLLGFLALVDKLPYNCRS